MKADHVVLFEQESERLPDDTRWAVRLELWRAEVNMRTRWRYFMLMGSQIFDGKWSWQDTQYILLGSGNPAHHIRHAIKAYDKLVGVTDD